MDRAERDTGMVARIVLILVILALVGIVIGYLVSALAGEQAIAEYLAQVFSGLAGE